MDVTLASESVAGISTRKVNKDNSLGCDQYPIVKINLGVEKYDIGKFEIWNFSGADRIK